MRKFLLVLMAVGLFGAVPAFAAEHADMEMDSSAGVRECALQAETLQQRIDHLKAEDAKGTKKYSSEELKKIELKLKEANKMLETLTTGP